MKNIGIIFWFSMALIIGCGRYEVNVPDPNPGNSTNTSTSTGTSTKKTTDKEDEKSSKPESITGSASNTPTTDSTVQVDVDVDVKVSVKVNTRTINGTQYAEDQQLNYYVLPQNCISLNRFDKKGRQLYSSWDGENTVRLYTYNSCWPKSDDVLVKRDETITVCQKNLHGSLVCNLVWLIEINPNDLQKSIREYLDNIK